MEVEHDMQQVNDGISRDRSMNSGKLEEMGVLNDTLQVTVDDSRL
jgi:hypothetical protein